LPDDENEKFTSHLGGFMNKKFAMATVCVLIFVLQACSNTSPTPISEPAETATLATLTSTPTPTLTPTSTPTNTPTPIPLAWQQISDGQEFERDMVTAFATDKNDPEVIYAAMKNTGVYKTIDGGLSWQPVLHGLTTKQVESLLIDSQNPHILYAGMIGGVFKTEDGGENWSKVGEGTYLLMDYQDNSHFYARDENGIYETTDQGNNWTTVYTLKKDCPDIISSWAIHPADGNMLFIGGGKTCAGVYQSGDGGDNWILIGLEDKPNLNPLVIALAEQGNYSIYANFESPIVAEGGMYVSHDRGLNWSFTQGMGGNILTFDPDNPATIYCAGSRLFVMRKKGDTWKQIPDTQSKAYTAVHIDHPNGTNRILTSGTNFSNQSNPYVSLFISTDGGISWAERHNGLGSTRAELKIDTMGNTGMYMATYTEPNSYGFGCKLYRSTDNGKSWLTIKSGATWCGPAFDSANAFYLIELGALQKSWNGGRMWLWNRHEPEGSEVLHRLPEWFQFDSTVKSISANPYINGLIYAAGNNIYYSTIGGGDWQLSGGSDGLLDARLFYTNQSKMIYAIGRTHQSYSTDNGVIWQNCGQDVTASQSDTRLALDVQGSLLYLATLGQGVMVSNDSCQSWQSSNNGLSNLFVNTLAIDPNNSNTIYAGTDGGAYISYDSGATWGQVNDGLLGATVVYSIAVDKDSNVYAATPYGIFKLEGE
jgi:photosystem II stability/assembly factor-like uncharacterized protein